MISDGWDLGCIKDSIKCIKIKILIEKTNDNMIWYDMIWYDMIILR